MILFEGLGAVIEQHNPHECAVEETFVNSNARAALALGQARGVALAAAARRGRRRGRIRADDDQEGRGRLRRAPTKRKSRSWCSRLLPTAGDVSADAADALGVALCHAAHGGFRRARRGLSLGNLAPGSTDVVLPRDGACGLALDRRSHGGRRRPVADAADAAGIRCACSEARLRGVLDSISDGFYAVDRDWRLTRIQSRGRTILPHEARWLSRPRSIGSWSARQRRVQRRCCARPWMARRWRCWKRTRSIGRAGQSSCASRRRKRASASR